MPTNEGLGRGSFFIRRGHLTGCCLLLAGEQGDADGRREYLPVSASERVAMCAERKGLARGLCLCYKSYKMCS